MESSLRNVGPAVVPASRPSGRLVFERKPARKPACRHDCRPHLRLLFFRIDPRFCRRSLVGFLFDPELLEIVFELLPKLRVFRSTRKERIQSQAEQSRGFFFVALSLASARFLAEPICEE